VCRCVVVSGKTLHPKKSGLVGPVGAQAPPGASAGRSAKKSLHLIDGHKSGRQAPISGQTRDHADDTALPPQSSGGEGAHRITAQEMKKLRCEDAQRLCVPEALSCGCVCMSRWSVCALRRCVCSEVEGMAVMCILGTLHVPPREKWWSFEPKNVHQPWTLALYIIFPMFILTDQISSCEHAKPP
jgi:hypothetical protein